MSTKRSNKEIKKLASDVEFSVKQSGKDSLFIEGFANKATVDRGDEIIATDAWSLDNFKKNPVILYNHGIDILGGSPVGKAVEVSPTEDGLFIKARLSNSKTPNIQMVRDLVEERILKAFSVGFDPKETDLIEVEGKSIRKITKAELYEVSIVGVPMNQDSVFELSGKMLETKSLHEIKTEFLKAKGAEKALAIEAKFVDVSDRRAVIEAVADELDLEVIEVKDMLAGDTDLPESVIKAFETKLEGSKEAPKDEEVEDGDEEGKDEEGKDEGKGAHEEEGTSSGEDGESEEEDSSKKDFQECVNSKIPKLINEGKERDEAVAQAIAMCQEEGKCALTPEGKLAAFEACFQALDSTEDISQLSINLGETVTFTKQVTEEKQGDASVSTPISTDVKENDFGSPFLDAAKQTNVMLGTLINEIQGLRSDIASMKVSEPTSTSESQSESASQGTEGGDKSAEGVDYAKKRLENLNQRLKNLGV